MDLPDGPPDRGGAVGLFGQRQGVRRDHVGGTPTSSNGGTATQLQVFALGGSQEQSTAQRLPSAVERSVHATTTAAPKAPPHRAARQGVGRIVTQQGLVVRPWQAESSNLQAVKGRVLWNGAPVAGAHVVVDRYDVPRPTAKDGSFRYDVDSTIPLRHAVRVGALGGATVHGRPLTPGQQTALRAASGGFSVGYAIRGLSAHTQEDGSVVLTGRVSDTAGNAPPPVHLLTYQLKGTITDASGKPVQGAVVITRTQDRDFWTHSSPSGANGRYFSFFAASDETAADPVPISVGVAVGSIAYGGTLGINVQFARLKSATMNIQLGSGTTYSIPQPTSEAGAVYSGLVVGVSAGRRVVKPLAELEGCVLDQAPRIGPRADADLLAEPPAVVLALSGAGRRRGRPELLAGRARRRRSDRPGDAEDPAPLTSLPVTGRVGDELRHRVAAARDARADQ